MYIYIYIYTYSGGSGSKSKGSSLQIWRFEIFQIIWKQGTVFFSSFFLVKTTEPVRLSHLFLATTGPLLSMISLAMLFPHDGGVSKDVASEIP